MAQLMEGTKVKTTDGLTGCVEARYHLGTVVYYVVKMDDGALHKYFADQLTAIEEEPEKAPEEEATESDMITISREELLRVVGSVFGTYSAKLFVADPHKGLDFLVHGLPLSKLVCGAIFEVAEKNV